MYEILLFYFITTLVSTWLC